MPTVYNKVTAGGNTLIDLSQDTVTQASHIMAGHVGHLADGTQVTGTGSGGGTYQAKTNISPTESSQTITPDYGYDALSSVQINAVSSSYVGSGITRRDSTDLSASTLTVTAPAGYYASQATKTLTDANLVAGNIKKDVSIFNVTGTYEGSGGGGSYAWLGDGAEKIDTKDFSFNLSSGTSYDSWNPSTTASAIKSASSSNNYTLQANLTNYDYCLVTKGYMEPAYVSGTPTTYRTHRVVQYYLYYAYGYPSNNTTSQVQNDTAGATSNYTTSSNCFIQYYYNSSGTITSRTATQCGPCYMSTNPTISAGTPSSGVSSITYKLPAFNAKCDSSRFSTARAAQVDSANTTYSLTLEVYRVPHGKGLASHLVSEMCAALNA